MPAVTKYVVVTDEARVDASVEEDAFFDLSQMMQVKLHGTLNDAKGVLSGEWTRVLKITIEEME